MRKLVIVIFYLLIRYPLYSQTIMENKIYQIYNVPNLSSEEIFTEIHFALSLLYQDSEDVIKYINGNTKKIVVKAQALVPVLDAYKLMNPNETVLSDYIDYSHNYTLIIEVKDEKYRVELIYQNGKYTDSSLTEYKLPFSARMDFTAEDIQEILQKARIEMSQDIYLMTSRRKKEIYIQSQPKVVKEYQQTLIDYATIFFQSLYKQIYDDINQKEW
ncbi:MAG: hypothetical protein CMC03_01685 [Flavobacteriaceae bacterium]|nr:hypothetical protein [Flavobacteriaceae bacterium]